MDCFRQSIFLFSAMLLMCSGLAHAQEDVAVRTVNVIGTAEILNKNIAAAKEQALSACLISAVNTAAAEIFPAEDRTHNFSKLCKILYDDAGKFIRDYKILAEFRTEKTYRIMLEATVITDRIKSLEAQLEKVSVQKLPESEKMEELPPEDVQKLPESEKAEEPPPENAVSGEMTATEILGEDEAVPEKTGTAETSVPTAQAPVKPEPANSMKAMPSVLFLLAEQNLEKDSFQYWWGGQSASLPSFSETAIGDVMQQKGFSVVNHGYRTSDGKGRSDMTYPPDLDNREAISMGTRMNAGVVIVGKTVVYKVSGAGPGEVAFSSTVSARALRTGTGEEIAATFQTAVKTGTNETEGSKNALSAAGVLAGEDLSLQIAKVWQKAYARLSEAVAETAPADAGVEKLPPEKTQNFPSLPPVFDTPPSSDASAGAEKLPPRDSVSATPVSESPVSAPAAQSDAAAGDTVGRPEAALPQKQGAIEIRVRGIRELGNFMNFRRTLTDIPGVKTIQILEMKADEAGIGVNFDGNSVSLADALSVKIFELFYMKVYNVSENSMTIDLIPK